jgi:hypothetical protein
MTQTKPLLDEYGVINEAHKKLPSDDLRIRLVESLAELEDNECHRTRQFPRTRLHRVVGIQQAVYRADIGKTSGWRLHVQYIDKQIHLKDVIEGGRHDDVLKVIKAKRVRYE